MTSQSKTGKPSTLINPQKHGAKRQPLAETLELLFAEQFDCFLHRATGASDMERPYRLARWGLIADTDLPEHCSDEIRTGEHFSRKLGKETVFVC
ncbi:hypothetical protein Y1Q_0010979 [Alligator mississippiensis]|uniref:Uncharacterized protein n=1 Tax=Alligator mississippiensis TaxID=8496 RepID=A0A151NLA9_ALLMI|nr:hypothetical protein Y1Q_0010979 [Alligator mississippiensis]